MQHGMPGRPCAPQMKTGPLPGPFRDEPVADDVDVVYSDSGELSLPFSKNSTSDWYLSYKRSILDSHRHIGVELVMETPNPATYGSKGYQAKITVSLAQTQTVERCGPWPPIRSSSSPSRTRGSCEWISGDGGRWDRPVRAAGGCPRIAGPSRGRAGCASVK